MADDVLLNAATSSGDTLGADDIGGIKFQRVKLIIGANNTNDGDVASGNPLPVNDAGGNLSIDDGGNSITVDGSVTATQGTASNLKAEVTNAGTFAVQATLQASTNTQEVVGDVAHDAAIAGNPITVGAVASAAAPTDVSADQDAVRLWALRSGALAQQPTFAGVLGVAGNGVSGTGVQRVTMASDSTGILAGVTTVTTLTTLTGGAVAHDGADSGNPVKVGVKAETSPKGITLVADGDRTDLYADADGILIIKNGTANADLQSERLSNTDGSATAFSTFGATSGLRNMITAIAVHNAHATTNGYIDFRDGTAGAILWTLPLPATGGSIITFDPPLRQPTSNTAFAYDVSAAITTVYISVNGYQSKA